MLCRCCRSLMVQVRSQSSSSSRQEWRECPVCHRVGMTSTPQRQTDTPTNRQATASSNNAYRRAL